MTFEERNFPAKSKPFTRKHYDVETLSISNETTKTCLRHLAPGFQPLFLQTSIDNNKMINIDT